MRVLVTAGGTRVPIDEVRWIGNFSTGAFGAKIAAAFLKQGAEVVHLHGTNAQMPFVRRVDLSRDLDQQVAELRRSADELTPHKDRYRAFAFSTFDQYAARLERLLREQPIDVVVLAAAVSDYALAPVAGKISSNQDELVLRLKRTPKLIAKIKEWAPGVFLVGFKLLVGVSQGELIDVALQSARTNRCDVVVANDLAQMQAGDHTIHLVREGHPVETYRSADNAAERLAERVAALWTESRG